MNTYAVLLRGINVGGKNKIKMADLRELLEEHGFLDVRTYIQSGNVVLRSELNAEQISSRIEQLLIRSFALDSSIVRVLCLSHGQLAQAVEQAPSDFGTENERFRYDVIFCLDQNAEEVFADVPVRPEIDRAAQGPGVVYYRRPAPSHPAAGRSWLSKLVGRPVYLTVTIRNWNTTLKLLDLLQEQAGSP